MFRPYLLAGPYIPDHDANRMASEGDVAGARQAFMASRFNNLDVLLEQRFGWMRDYLRTDDVVVEFGCGAGFSRLYLDHPRLILTDVLENEWVDQHADAMNPPFGPASVDVIICSHMIHHMAQPVKFFANVRPVLRPGGRILIQDLNTSLMMRLMLQGMRHEGWSYDIDVFDEDAVTNDPKDPWSANCAIPQLLFRSSAEFERCVPGYSVTKNELNECLLFPFSGGVIAKTPVPELPRFLLTGVQALDRLLVKVAPAVFAVGRSVVLTKQAKA
ncbi:MAG: class I SAM-dependent methyltransferase [Sphingomicrobium sp.]